MLAGSARGQDLVVTDKGDSVNCRITKVKAGYIHFTFYRNNEVRKTVLRKDQVRYYQRRFYVNPAVPPSSAGLPTDDYPKFRLGGYLGFGYRTARLSSDIPPEFRDYVKDLKKGIVAGGDCIYFISESMGFGAKYALFNAQNRLEGIYAVNNQTGQIVQGTLSDNITIQFIGASYCNRLRFARNKAAFVSNLSIGYQPVSNRARLIEPFLLTSRTWGVSYEFSLEVLVRQDLLIGITGDYIGGSLSYYDYSNSRHQERIKLENREGIGRIHASVGLRWMW